MNNKKILAVYGGSFNPPLNSHFSIAEQMLNEYEEIDKIIFVPVSSKYEKNGLVNNEHRYNMLKLVCDKNDDFILSDIELKQTTQLHTVETLELLQKQYPNNRIYFTIGTDNLKELSTWGNPERLLTDFKIFVLERDKDNMDEIIENDEFLKKYRNSLIKVKENIRSNISSTFVREKLKQGKSIRYLTPDEVYYYIKENSLYSENLEIVKTRLYEKSASLVVMFENMEIKEYYNRRVEDIVEILKKDKNALKNAIIADKVIGKVAASLLAIAGVKEIYANTLSRLAIPVLEENNIKYDYNRITDYIINNDKTGMCPMENKFKDEKDLNVIYNYFIKEE